MMNKKQAIEQLDSMRPMDSKDVMVAGIPLKRIRYSREQVEILLDVIYDTK